MDDHFRHAIHALPDSFDIKGTPSPIEPASLLQKVDEHPEQFSPNVILRPIVQDSLFPSIAYIAGPGEIAYFAQLKSAYTWAGISMPLIYPRASVTLIEPTIAKILDRYDSPLNTYNEDPQKLFRSFAIDHLPIDLDLAVTEATEQIHRAIDTLSHTAATVDPGLYTSAEATKVRFEKALNRYREKVIKAQKRNQSEDKARLIRAAVHLYPKQKLQERTLSPLHFLNAYGLDFFNSLSEHVSLDTTQHQIIRL